MTEIQTRPPVDALIEAILNRQEPAAGDAHTQLIAWTQHQPDDAQAWLGVGLGHALQSRWAEGQKAFEAALEVNPQMAVAWSNLGNVLKLQGDAAGARKAYTKAIAQDPALPDAHYNLAILAKEAGNTEEAQEAVQRSLLFRPSYPEALYLAGTLANEAGKLDEAASRFKQTLAFKPGWLAVRLDLILMLYRLGRTDEAEAEVNQALKEHPGNLQILRVQAAGLAQTGRLQAAGEITEALLKADPNAADLQFNKAEVLTAQGEHEAALDLYKQLLNRPEVHPAMVIAAMGHLATETGDISQAKAFFQEALALATERPTFMIRLAMAQLTAGEVKPALALLQKVQSLPKATASDQARCLQAWPMATTPSTAADFVKAYAEWVKRWRKEAPPTQAPAQSRVAVIATPEYWPMLQNWLPSLNKTKSGPSWVVYMCGVVPGIPSLDWKGSDKPNAPKVTTLVGLTEHEWVQRLTQDGINGVIDWVGLSQPAVTLALENLNHLPVLRAPVEPICLPTANANTAKQTRTSSLIWPDTYPVGSFKLVPRPASPQGAGPIFAVDAALSTMHSDLLDAWASIMNQLPEAKLRYVSTISSTDTATRERLQRWMILRDVDPKRVEVVSVPKGSPSLLSELAACDVWLDASPHGSLLALDRALNLGLTAICKTYPEPWQNPCLSRQHATDQLVLSDSWDGYVQNAVRLGAEKAVAPSTNRKKPKATPWSSADTQLLLDAIFTQD